ncbi:hypothetical protein OSTOST_10481 [Ostertagia ostertagi]
MKVITSGLQYVIVIGFILCYVEVVEVSGQASVERCTGLVPTGNVHVSSTIPEGESGGKPEPRELPGSGTNGRPPQEYNQNPSGNDTSPRKACLPQESKVNSSEVDPSQGKSGGATDGVPSSDNSASTIALSFLTLLILSGLAA